MLPLKDLVDSIAEKLKEQLFVGSQLYGKKNDRVCPCKILEVMHEDAKNVSYVVAWLDESNNVIERAEISSQDLVQKKPPFSRNILKSFVRECTYRNAPWVLHDKLAKKHGISTDIPEELRGKVSFNNGFVVFTKKRKHEVGRHREVVVSVSILFHTKLKRKRVQELPNVKIYRFIAYSLLIGL